MIFFKNYFSGLFLRSIRTDLGGYIKKSFLTFPLSYAKTHKTRGNLSGVSKTPRHDHEKQLISRKPLKIINFCLREMKLDKISRKVTEGNLEILSDNFFVDP